MDLIKSDDARYDEARTVFNSMVDKRPAVIAQCATPDDVAAALELARTDRLDVAVRAGGHSVAGMSLNDGGLVIDVRPMKEIAVDATARTVRVGAGVTWGEFDRATQEHGLAATGGRVSTTGVAGLTLGGGSGWLERSFGLSCDNLCSAELVTADGSQITASETEHPDLFWALHGGGGNFGVATTLEFNLHPVGPIVLAGLLMWPGDAGNDVASMFRDHAYDMPDELGSALVFMTGPPEPFMPEHLQGTPVVGIGLCWMGEPADGEAAIAPFLELQPEVNLVEPMPYADFQCMIDDPPGFRNYWTAEYHDDFPDEAVEVFVKYGHGRPSPLSQQLFLPWGGAVSRVPEDATPMTKRSAPWITHPFAVWEDPADDAENIAWARGFRDDIAHYATGGVYLNFIGHEGPERVRAAFGDAKYQRLAEIKAEYDPGNVFQGNQNIQPAG